MTFPRNIETLFIINMGTLNFYSVQFFIVNLQNQQMKKQIKLTSLNWCLACRSTVCVFLYNYYVENFTRTGKFCFISLNVLLTFNCYVRDNDETYNND